MNRMLFTPDAVEQTVRKLDTFRNDFLGLGAFGFGFSALPLKQDAPAMASVALAFIFLWGMAKVWPERKAHDRFYGNMSFVARNVVPIIRNPVLVAGLAFLVFVAAGLITIDSLSGFSLARMYAA
ncbi:hypothetical protein [Propionivibrio sp.]|uniref:hypothetical protein n=1 Tax=Propionivibrio sp. TaxID=2212460 RepID=UPI003BF29F78